MTQKVEVRGWKSVWNFCKIHNCDDKRHTCCSWFHLMVSTLCYIFFYYFPLLHMCSCIATNINKSLIFIILYFVFIKIQYTNNKRKTFNKCLHSIQIKNEISAINMKFFCCNCMLFDQLQIKYKTSKHCLSPQGHL